MIMLKNEDDGQIEQKIGGGVMVCYVFAIAFYLNVCFKWLVKVFFYCYNYCILEERQ